MVDVLRELPDQRLRFVRPGGVSARTAVFSLPWPGSAKAVPQVVGPEADCVPLFDPTEPTPHKRYLVLAQGRLPQSLRVRASKVQKAPKGQRQPAAAVQIVPTREGLEPYMHREDEARLTIGRRTIGLRLGLELAQGISWWQWAKAEPLWNGKISSGWRIGGHIPAYTLDATPAIDPQWTLYDRMERLGGMQIAADVFLIVFQSGVVRITAHFKNNFFHVPACDVPGLPVVAVSGLQGTFADQTLAQAADRQALDQPIIVDGGAGDQLDLGDCGAFFDAEHPGQVRAWAEGSGVIFRPFDRAQIVAHKTKDGQLLYLGEPSQKGLPAGVSRSVRISVGLDGQSPTIGRYEVPGDWYGLCGEITGQAQKPVIRKAMQWAAAPRDALYHYTAVGGFDTGRVWRYLRRDQRSGIPQIDDAEWEGGTSQALFRDAYLRPKDANWPLILHHVYHYADIAVHHDYAMIRCHGYHTTHMPLPMMRVGGLVMGYLETGDPYLLETARGVADSFMRMDESNQPRYSIGRDAYPLAGLMTLYDYTGDRRYLGFGRTLVQRLLRTQWAEGGFSGQGGVGLLAGNCNKQAGTDISFGSGLLAPIALVEWALRDTRHPGELREHLQRWVDLVLRSQSQRGSWDKVNKDGSRESYPLIPAGLLCSLTGACHLLDDRRGLAAMQRYLDYAMANQEYVLGTHSFLAVLYAAFYDTLAAAAKPGTAQRKRRRR